MSFVSIQKYLTCIFIFFMALQHHVTAKGYNITVFDTQNGLSQNDVQCIFQDSKGFVWIGTNDGLNRFDGYEFKVFQIGDFGLQSNLILSVCEDHLTNLWIATADKGLFYYQRNKGIFINIASLPANKGKLLPVTARHLTSDKHGNVWGFDEEKNRIVRISFNAEALIVTDVLTLPFKDVLGLEMFMEGSQDQIVITTSQGIFLYDIVKNQEAEVVCQEAIVSSALVANNKLIYTTPDHIMIYNLYSHSKKILKHVDKPIAIKYVKNQLWMVSHDGIETADFNYSEDLLGNSERVESYLGYISNSIAIDNLGGIWVGFLKTGMRKYDRILKPFGLVRSDDYMGNKHITALLEDKAMRFWVGTEGTGLFVMSKAELDSPYKWQQMLYGEIINCLSISDDEKYIFCGTQEGYVYKIDVKTLSTVRFPFRFKGVKSLLIDSPFIWLASYYDGLIRIDITKGTFAQVANTPSLPTRIVRSLAKDSYGNILLGTNIGLFSVQRQAKAKEELNVNTVFVKDSLTMPAGGYVIPILQTANGDIWYGTLGEGISVLSPIPGSSQYSIKRINKNNGLSNNTVKSLLQDDKGNVWASTNRGLNCINAKSLLVQEYDNNDGLQSLEFMELSGYKCKNGMFLFGGVNGFNSFFPDQILSETTPPKVVITDFYLFNKNIWDLNDEGLREAICPSAIEEAKVINLKYFQNSFSFQFTALHFANPAKNRYAYMLDGFDKEWVQSPYDKRLATYTNVPPGKYIFLLKACNGDGIWTQYPLSIGVTVDPPIWKRWYAYMVYFLFVLLLLVLIYYNIERKHKRKNELLVFAIEKEQAKEILELKTRFFTNISHEFRTPLTLILSPLQKLASQPTVISNESLMAPIRTMAHNGNILLKLVTELLNYSKNEQGKLVPSFKDRELVDFVKTVVSQFAYWAEQKNITIKVEHLLERMDMRFDPFMLEQVLYNLLSNAMKHTPRSGEIFVRVAADTSNAIITVADTGVGISADEQHKVFERYFSSLVTNSSGAEGIGIGLSLSKSMVELHNGHIAFESSSNGTIFYVSLPIVSPEQLSPLPSSVPSTVLVQSNENLPLLQALTANVGELPILWIVEDNLELQNLLRSIFEPIFAVVTSNNGHQAWEGMVDTLPDLVLTDVLMPVMDGIQLCQLIKSDERTSHIPVVVLTALVSNKNIVSGYEAQADAYCTKPFDNDVLLATVHSILLNRKVLAQKFKRSIVIGASEIATTDKDAMFIDKLLKSVTNNMSNSDYSVEDLASMVNLTSIVLNKKLKSLLDTTANAFIRSIRLKHAAQLLKSGQYTVSETMYECGFNDVKYFRECFKKEFGVVPVQYKQGQQK